MVSYGSFNAFAPSNQAITALYVPSHHPMRKFHGQKPKLPWKKYSDSRVPKSTLQALLLTYSSCKRKSLLIHGFSLHKWSIHGFSLHKWSFPYKNRLTVSQDSWLHAASLLCQKLIVFKTNAAVSGSIALYHYKQLLTTKMASHGKLDALWVNR